MEKENGYGNPASIWDHKIPFFPTFPPSLFKNVKHEKIKLYMILKDANIVVQ